MEITGVTRKKGKKNRKYGRNKIRGQASLYRNYGRLKSNKEKAMKRDEKAKALSINKWEEKDRVKRGTARRKRRIGISRKSTTVIGGE